MSFQVQYVGPVNILDNVTLESGGPGALVISQVESSSFNLRSDMNYKSSGGQMYRTFAGIMGQMPGFNCVTEALAQFLTAVGAEGLIGSTGIELYNTLNDPATGKRKSGSYHEKVAFTKYVVIPRTLSCSAGQNAKLNFDVIGVSSDGTTAPAVLTSGSVALPSISGVTEQFTLGPVKIKGTLYEGIQDVTIDFGIKEVMKKNGNEIYPKLVAFEQIQPKITIKTEDAAVLAALSLTGLAQNTTASVIYFAKCASNGVRVANATAEHISFTINAGLWMPQDKGGSHPGNVTTGFEIEPIYDGTHAPMVLSAATAIS